MVWRAGGGGPIRRCIGSTGNLHSYTYQSQGMEWGGATIMGQGGGAEALPGSG